MKKWLIPVGIIAVIIFIVIAWSSGIYNSAVDREANAQQTWADVESSYQRRNDLIGNLVNTVQGAAEFERGTLTDVIEARSRATSVNVNAENMTAEQMEQFRAAQGEVSSALSRLLVTVERYPDLKANQNFLNLQAQLEGTENRINVARNRYNESVTEYNKYIRRFPNNIFVGFYGFDEMPLYQADPGSEDAPEVEFDFS